MTCWAGAGVEQRGAGLDHYAQQQTDGEDLQFRCDQRSLHASPPSPGLSSKRKLGQDKRDEQRGNCRTTPWLLSKPSRNSFKKTKRVYGRNSTSATLKYKKSTTGFGIAGPVKTPSIQNVIRSIVGITTNKYRIYYLPLILI